jgi:hypothetical protein
MVVLQVKLRIVWRNLHAHTTKKKSRRFTFDFLDHIAVLQVTQKKSRNTFDFLNHIVVLRSNY